jgi:hypothetical protein
MDPRVYDKILAMLQCTRTPCSLCILGILTSMSACAGGNRQQAVAVAVGTSQTNAIQLNAPHRQQEMVLLPRVSKP